MPLNDLAKVFFTLQCKDCECVRTSNLIKYRFLLGLLSIFNTLDQNNKQVLESGRLISAANTVRIYCKRLNSASQRVSSCSPLLLKFCVVHYEMLLQNESKKFRGIRKNEVLTILAMSHKEVQIFRNTVNGKRI